MCLTSVAAGIENGSAAAQAQDSLTQVEASVRNWLARSECSDVSEVTDIFEDEEWGIDLELDQVAHWTFAERAKGGEVDNKTKRRNAFDSGMSRPSLAEEVAACNILMCEKKSRPSNKNRKSIWGLVRRVGLIGAAAAGAVTLTI